MLFFKDIFLGIHQFKKENLQSHPYNKNEKPLDPILPVADAIRRETTFLCFDEFQVNDLFLLVCS